MKICIIYHSETGNTRHVAQHLSAAFDSKLVEISETAPHSQLTKFLVWCKMARGEELTKIAPESIDVLEYDLIVFGSPVWAFKPTPAIHTAIANLKGCMGKPAVAFSTHGGRPGKTDEIFKTWIEERGMVLDAVTNINQKDIENVKTNKDLIALVSSAIKV
ncbi:MAG: NAD(P)H-dependent oxidoreductase [Methanomicrobiales archaeon]